MLYYKIDQIQLSQHTSNFTIALSFGDAVANFIFGTYFGSKIQDFIKLLR